MLENSKLSSHKVYFTPNIHDANTSLHIESLPYNPANVEPATFLKPPQSNNYLSKKQQLIDKQLNKLAVLDIQNNIYSINNTIMQSEQKSTQIYEPDLLKNKPELFSNESFIRKMNLYEMRLESLRKQAMLLEDLSEFKDYTQSVGYDQNVDADDYSFTNDLLEESIRLKTLNELTWPKATQLW